MSLLSKAKSFKIKERVSKEVNKEDIELAVAWAKGEITAQQVVGAYGAKSFANIHHKLLKSLKIWVRDNA